MEGFEILCHSDFWDEGTESDPRREKLPERRPWIPAKQLRDVVLRGDAAHVEELLRAQKWPERALLDALKHVQSAGAAEAFASCAPEFFRNDGGAKALFAAVKEVDEKGWSALHYAVSEGQMENMRWLLNNGFSLSCRAYDGSTPLHLVVEDDYSWVVKELLVHRAPVNAVDNLGRTALHMASLGTDLQMVRTLLEWGAAREIRDVNGRTAAQLAVLPEIRAMIQQWALAA